MNNYKICFITCVNDSVQYQKMMRYIESLIIPPHYEIEVMKIENASSMCSGYNEAMRKSDAKYKVYLHQDTYILHQNFIADIVSLFQQEKDLGIVGVIGSDNLNQSAKWWHNSGQWGTIYDSTSGFLAYSPRGTFNENYKEVVALDGLILITQYDIWWREDIFDGWHFYDLSQCQEFINKGFKVGVVKQKSPWCLHDCGPSTYVQYDVYEKKFIETYLLESLGD